MSRVLGGMRRAGASASDDGASARRLAISALCVSLLTLLAACSTSAAESPLRSWGSNGYGQLGLGDTDNRLAPAVVAFFAGTAITGATGGNPSLATTDDGALWAWGRNSHGQLGLGDSTSRSSPERVASLSSRTTTAIAAGLDFSLALTSGHTVWAWGRNQNGQLGLGDTTNRNVPTEVTALAGKSVVSLAACNTHAFALTSDGKMWAWGANGSGQLGLGYTSISVTTPTEVAALSGVTVSSISAGYYHSAAITADGRLLAWGKNTYGQLGLGDTTDRTSPTVVPTFVGMTVSRVVSGCYHTLVNTSDGRAWCFGWNYYGQLGQGDTSDRHVPTEITELRAVRLRCVAAGDQHCLAVLKGKTLPSADDQTVHATTCSPVSITLTGSDGDGDPLTYHLVTAPTHGTLTGDAPNVIYTSADSLGGSDTFTFKVNDGQADSAPGTVSIIIHAAATTLYTIDRSGTITGLVILRQFDLKRTTDGALLEGRTISFKVDGTEVGTGTTNAGGDSTLNWIITEGPATRTITAEFEGDEAHNGCSDDAVLTAQTHATKMSGVNREGKITAYRILKAWLYRLDNTPVVGKAISFKLDGTPLGTDPTRSTGLAQIGYTIADGAGAGVRTILAEWAGDGGYLPSSCTNTLTVQKATPYIWVMPRSVPQGGVARLYAYFRRLIDYQKQEGKTVSFKVDGTWIADVVTLSGADAGIARYQYTTTEPVGVHTMRCEFAGDAWVDAGYGEATLTIY